LNRMRYARGEVSRCFHRLRATGFFFASPSGEVAAGRRGVVRREVGCRAWEMGAVFGAGRLVLAAPKPPPLPSPKGGRFVRCGLRAAGVSSPSSHTTNHALRTQRADTPVRPYFETNHEPHEPRTTTTGHRLQATCRSFPIPRTKPPLAAEIRGPCRPERQDFVAAVPFATSYALRAFPSPSPPTTNPRADTRVRPYDKTRYESRATTTSYKLFAAVSSFQPSEF